MRKLAIGTLFCMFMFFNAQSQTPDKKWAIGLNLGLSEYSGDMGNGFLKFDLAPHRIYNETKSGITHNNPGFYGLNISRYMNSRVDLNVSGSYGETGYYSSLERNFYHKFLYVDATIRWKFMANDNACVKPYFMVGLGVRRTYLPAGNSFNVDMVDDIVIPVGIGMNIKCSESVNFNVQSHYGWTNGDMVEGNSNYTRFSFDQLWHHSIGLSYSFGKN